MTEAVQSLEPRRFLLAGGGGYLGTRLARALVARGDVPIVLSRSPRREMGWPEVFWDGERVGPWVEHFNGAAGLVNLAGKNVMCRPTQLNREGILRSRVNSVQVLGEAMRHVLDPPPVWVQASSLAIYGDGGERLLGEGGRLATEWPASVCTAWEEALGRAVLPHQRLSILRIGFVLGREGGALPLLMGLARAGLGGRQGSGRQWMSWLHETDMDEVFLRALDEDAYAGILNVTSPNPERNSAFMQALRRRLNRPLSLPSPAWAIRLGAKLLGNDPQLALVSRRAIPERLDVLRFRFAYPDLASALDALVGPLAAEGSETVAREPARWTPMRRGEASGRPLLHQ